MVAALLALALAGSAVAAAPQPAPDPTAWDADGPVVAMAAHGDRVFAAGEFYWVRERIGGQGRFRTSDGALRRELPEIGRPQIAASDGAGGFYVAGSTCGARIWHVDAAGRQVPGFAVDTVDGLQITTLFDIAVSPDRRTVYASLIVNDADDLGETPMLVAFDARTGARTTWRPQDRSPDYTRDLQISPDGRTLYAIGDPWWEVPDSNLVAFDTATGVRRPLDTPLDALAFSHGKLSPDGGTLYVRYETEDYEHGMAAIDLTSGALRWELDTPVADIEPAPDGNTVFAGGSFTAIGGVAVEKLARLDAATGAVTPWRAGFTTVGSIGELAISADGATLYAAGSFGGGSTRDVATVRVSDGRATRWGWQIGDGAVYDMALTGDGSELYVVGSFETLATQRRAGLAQFDADGRPIDWDPIEALDSDFKRNPTAIAVAPDGSVVYMASEGWDGINRVEAFSATDERRLWEVRFNGQWPPHVLEPALGGRRLFVGGDIVRANGMVVDQLAVIDTRDGTVEPWAPSVDGHVYGLAEVNGALVIGGDFDAIDGTTREQLAAVDAASLALLPFNPGSEAWVASLEPRPSRGTVLVGRYGTGRLAGVQRGALAELRVPDGTATAFDAPLTRDVWDAAPTADGQLVFATGLFGSGGGGERLVALDGTTGAVTSWGTWTAPDYFQDRYKRVELTARGDLFTAGGFTTMSRNGACPLQHSALARFAAASSPPAAYEPAPAPATLEPAPTPTPTPAPTPSPTPEPASESGPIPPAGTAGPARSTALAPDRTAPELHVRVRGRRVTVRADEAAGVRLVVRKRARVLVRRSLRLAPDTPRTVTVRLRGARRAVAVVTATDAAGNRASLRRVVRSRARMARHEL